MRDYLESIKILTKRTNLQPQFIKEVVSAVMHDGLYCNASSKCLLDIQLFMKEFNKLDIDNISKEDIINLKVKCTNIKNTLELLDESVQNIKNFYISSFFYKSFQEITVQDLFELDKQDHVAKLFISTLARFLKEKNIRFMLDSFSIWTSNLNFIEETIGRMNHMFYYLTKKNKTYLLDSKDVLTFLINTHKKEYIKEATEYTNKNYYEKKGGIKNDE